MRKPDSLRKRTVRELRTLIGMSRKLARQINRKIESLAQVNRMKQAAKDRLIKISGL